MHDRQGGVFRIPLIGFREAAAKKTAALSGDNRSHMLAFFAESSHGLSG